MKKRTNWNYRQTDTHTLRLLYDKDNFWLLSLFILVWFVILLKNVLPVNRFISLGLDWIPLISLNFLTRKWPSKLLFLQVIEKNNPNCRVRLKTHMGIIEIDKCIFLYFDVNDFNDYLMIINSLNSHCCEIKIIAQLVKIIRKTSS